MAVTEEQVYEALKPIEDPELHLGIVDLGLIYGVDISPNPEGERVRVIMTFTSPFCPYGPQLKSSVEQMVSALPNVKAVEVSVVFTPPWDPRTMASEDCKIALGLGWDVEDQGSSGAEGER